MTKTEELRKKIAEALYNHTHRWGMLCAFKDTPDYHKAIYYEQADKILKTCQKAGLAFVVKDAKLPENPHQSYRRQHRKSRPLGLPERVHAIAQNDMLKAGYRQTKEIEVRRKK